MKTERSIEKRQNKVLRQITDEIRREKRKRVSFQWSNWNNWVNWGNWTNWNNWSNWNNWWT